MNIHVFEKKSFREGDFYFAWIARVLIFIIIQKVEKNQSHKESYP